MRPITELIAELQTTTKPLWRLNDEIAVAVGYKKKVTYANQKRKVSWLSPDGKTKIDRVPNFTGTMNGAYMLAKMLAPEGTGGVTFGEISATAKVNDGPSVSAATSALAVCAAAMSSAQFLLADPIQRR